ncbi:hypothetical protein CMEL01_00844 [Colletotrichum melonis]|uniref:Uncharacterized protein n=2 Tax=Colletotrichum acutatum species complex TaxID=2707335 RepID=A0AAI9Y354_9PEZI|nr:hypothetical protein CLIM01_04249 [Colletotrichum limetticola]KAK1469077.1 hypothetical protein CMEL01_00844 [Colletotrichum melonis]
MTQEARSCPAAKRAKPVRQLPGLGRRRGLSPLCNGELNVGGEKTSNPRYRPCSELVGLGKTGRLAARLAVAGNCETCTSEATAHQPLLVQHWT